MTNIERDDVVLVIRRFVEFARWSPDGFPMLPCAREQASNARLAEACDRLHASGVLASIERDIWYSLPPSSSNSAISVNAPAQGREAYPAAGCSQEDLI